jgi:hypothetical protein
MGMMEERQEMTEEQFKFMFNLMYRYINACRDCDFGDLIDWAARHRVDDDTLMSMLDDMEESKLVVRQGERYSRL